MQAYAHQNLSNAGFGSDNNQSSGMITCRAPDKWPLKKELPESFCCPHACMNQIEMHFWVKLI